MGAGYENTDNYQETGQIKKCHLEFIGIVRVWTIL